MMKASNCIRLQPFEYERIENAFLNIVEKLGITEFPVDPFVVARLLSVELVKYSELPQAQSDWLEEIFEDGFSVRSGEDEYRIYYNDFMLETRMRFTLFYELGHIVLGHHDGSSTTTDARKQQAECNHFALFALAPMPLVIMSAPDSPEDIARWFGVSWQCAYYVYKKYLNVLRYRATVKMLVNSRIVRHFLF